MVVLVFNASGVGDQYIKAGFPAEPAGVSDTTASVLPQVAWATLINASGAGVMDTVFTIVLVTTWLWELVPVMYRVYDDANGELTIKEFVAEVKPPGLSE